MFKPGLSGSIIRGWGCRGGGAFVGRNMVLSSLPCFRHCIVQMVYGKEVLGPISCHSYNAD